MFSERAIERETAKLSERDAALCAQIVNGVLQNLYYLDFCVDCYCSTPAKRLEPKLLDILRLSAYQLLFLDRIPPRAAVNEAVELCRKNGLKNAAGLANAVLRRVAENRENPPEPQGRPGEAYLAQRYSHPLWLVRELAADYGAEFTEEFLRANGTQPPLNIQVNTLKTSEAALREKFAGAGIEASPGSLPGSLILTGAGKISALPGFSEGLFYVQDDAAKMAAEAAGALPGMTVLDACAAPGGKSFAVSMAMRGEGRVISCDIAEKKLRLIREGAARLGIGIIETAQMDARTPAPELFGACDVIIADAPCSGFGVVRKKPEIRYKSEEEVSKLPAIQLDILRGLADCVKPGGTLLYSTCTVRRAENESVAERFLEERRDFELAETRRLWPQLHKTDGFFICRMVRLK